MDISVKDLGALGDGSTYDTAAIQKAIDFCHEKGGGRVVLDGGCEYLSGSIILKANVDLHIKKGARLKASPDINDYIRPNEGRRDEGVDYVGTPVLLKPSYAFIYAYGADNISISGEGIIDGNCYAFVKRVDPYYVTGDFYPRPTLCYIENSYHITIRDVAMTNSPFWTLHPAGCEDVKIEGIRILNPLDVANSDGIDPDHSINVRIHGCHIECADDAICLKSSAGNMEYSDTQNIIISDCTLCTTSAAIKVGTEGMGNFKNVLVHDCIISSSNRGISIQIRDSGNAGNIHFKNILIETRRFSAHYWGCAEPIAITSFNRDENTVSGNITDVSFENINCESENGILLASDDVNKIKDIEFRNVKVNLVNKTKWEKDRYDLRPGINTGIINEKTKRLFKMNVEDVKIQDCNF